MNEQIVVALIGGGVTLIVSLLEWTRRQNNRDHASNAEKLDKVLDKVEKVDDRLSSHIDWHINRDAS
jgi:hypothetical protein